MPDTYIDDYFSLQYRFPSLETALWLHGLSLTIPFEPVMTFPFRDKYEANERSWCQANCR